MKDLSLHVLDLAQNSVKAGASRVEIDMVDDPAHDQLAITLKDNGCGMSQEMVVRVQDPFVTSRTTRKVGLGIPLFKQGCLDTGGTFSLTSQEGVGTIISGTYVRSHLDRPPMGDMAGSILSLVLANPRLDVRYHHEVGEQAFDFDAAEIRAELEDVPLDTPEVQLWLMDYLNEGMNTLYGGAQEYEIHK